VLDKNSKFKMAKNHPVDIRESKGGASKSSNAAAGCLAQRANQNRGKEQITQLQL